MSLETLNELSITNMIPTSIILKMMDHTPCEPKMVPTCVV